MAKAKEELNALREEVENVSKKLAELSEEELVQVTGGIKVVVENEENTLLDIINWFFKKK